MHGLGFKGFMGEGLGFKTLKMLRLGFRYRGLGLRARGLRFSV